MTTLAKILIFWAMFELKHRSWLKLV